MSSNYDFIAIGDITTDAFIRLEDASVHCSVDKENCMLCMRFKDKIPYEDVYVVPSVGNSPNAAVSAGRLGLKTGLVTNLGDDYFGKECLNALSKNKVAHDFVRVHAGKKTNYHYVLWFEDDRTILVKHIEYPYTFPDIGEPRWLYVSSMGKTSLPFHSEIAEYLSKHPTTKLAFQPGTYQIKFGKEKMAEMYARAEIVFMNKEESQRVLETEESDIKKLLEGIHGLGTRIAVITDGKKGAYSYDGQDYLFMRAYPDPKPPYERTGAGDAFSSTVTAALARGLDLKEALRWGPVNSMSVVQQVGAQAGLLTGEQIRKYLTDAPEDYYPKALY